MAREDSKDTIHILHLSYDNDDRSALTLLANDVRFHITADPKELQKGSDKTLYYEYLDKVTGLRDAEQREHDAAHRKSSPTNEKQKKGVKRQSKSEDNDSAVDVTADNDDENSEDVDQDSASAQVELRRWMLNGMLDTIATHAPPDRSPEPATLHDWYHGPTYFYSLNVAGAKLAAEQVEENKELSQRIERLVPHMKIPQYIQKMDVPWFDASKLTVRSEVEFPEPAHPGKVIDEDGAVFFFKPVVRGEPGPAKREISVLQKIASLALDIKAPRLEGFVGFEDHDDEIMGFLLSHIEAPVPLTELLKESVAQEKRDEWSRKSQEYVDTLHKHDIVWGDAKADNFMVDAEDELWIIDFGGSYTEGWVDPELAETLEGDEQGVERVRDALESPEEGDEEYRDEMERRGTPDPSATVKETASSLFVTEAQGRKRSHAEDDGDEEDSSSKRRREESQD
ncbi:protein kinase-like domain-containing protein [Stagonosporopsis vannaccii]|nr:protein kinase-like domain-containing protein [Stagonosporopsis vannaccii]